MLSAEDFEIKRITEPDYVLAYATSQGVISAADQNFLSEMLGYRNAIIHGFTAGNFHAEDHVIELIFAARQLRDAIDSTPTRQSDPSADVNVLNPLDVRNRLDALRRRQTRWIRGVGTAPSDEGLRWLSHSFEAHYPIGGPSPHTYPTSEGGIQMEWSFGANACVLTINLKTRKADWISIGEGAQTKDELTLDLNFPESWARIAEMVSGRSDAKVDG